MKNKFYITTPIYYINDVPHIGHSCTTVVADIVTRVHRQILGEEVFFLTGTDEHGQKVAECAEKEGVSPQEYCDRIAPKFQNAWRKLNISHDFFIRTTDHRHEAVVADVFEKIKEKGDVYKAKYEGYYCVGCESFKTETELVDGHCPLHPPEKTVKKSEDNWFFRLSKYVPEIIDKIEEENYIFPEGKRAEVLAKLKAGVDDISLSRENVAWGIPLPWDKKQTIYVWFDALLNYYSATRFVTGKKDFWPADVHVLGKEILWFHTVIWQAMLLSAGLALPKKTYIHSFYTIDGEKMSKSLGNVISPEELVEKFGADGARYLIARSFPAENDADVGRDRFVERYNADLANNLGNLVSRLVRLNRESEICFRDFKFEIDKKFVELIDQFRPDEAVGYIFEKYIDPTNAYLNKEAPWKLEANNSKRNEIIAECIFPLLIAAHHLRPIMPEAAEKIIGLFTKKDEKLEGWLFPRVEETKKIEGKVNKIVVGRVTAIEKLADKTIQMITAEVGNKNLRIVCGDLSLKIGDTVPVALPGAEVNGKDGKRKIKKSRIHGFDSEAMLCSGWELGKNEDDEIIFRLEKGVEIGKEVK